MNVTWKRAVLGVLAISALAAGSPGQTRPKVKFRTTQVRDNVYMLAGAGGNVGLADSADGLLLIDSEYAGLTDELLAAVHKISDKPIHFVVNTHWHFDHVGGNEELAELGAVIVAHENVRKRMSAEQYLRGIDRRVPPSPAGALPTITYTDGLTFHWNGEEISIIHVAPAHTDGDSIVYFRKANVVHLGDICFAGMYPFIDVNAGGSIDGMIDAVDQALALMNDETRIIPGHGPLCGVNDLRSYRQMLATVRQRVRALIDEGQSHDEAIASKPTSDLNASFSGALDPDTWVGLVYDSLTREPQPPPIAAPRDEYAD
jgi:cyclase